MERITVIWIALSFFAGFSIYLFPKLSRWIALGIAIASFVYSYQVFLQPSTIEIELLDSFGVSLMVDRLSGFFILTNAVVTAIVITYCWGTDKSKFFYMQAVILHGSVNATFVCVDFISLYVALEVISVAAFLLITYSRSDKSIWVGLRYLFVSNTAMLFYLIGAVLVYKANNSFNFAGLTNAPLEGITLIFLGLLVKGGIFVSGLWLPLTHSEAQTPVSAMLSGVVVKAGVFPLVRCAMMLAEIEPIVRLLGVATAILGVTYAICERDTKRTLAFSTVSQLGFILASPNLGGFYALTHGLAKSSLFLTAGSLPSRNFKELEERKIDTVYWLVLLVGGLSISGFPLLAGYAAKTLTVKSLLAWQTIAINISIVGTCIVYAKFIFLPHRLSDRFSLGKIRQNLGYLGASSIAIVGILTANYFGYSAYTLNSLVKSVVLIVLGWSIYLFLLKPLKMVLPQTSEKIDNLIGTMSLTLILLFNIFWVQIKFLI